MVQIERLIASTPQAHLLGGLFWRAPSSGKRRNRALLEAKTLTPDATHYAQAGAGVHARYGMYQPRASEDGVPLPRGTVAAAACFARLVGEAAPNAALVLAVPAAGRRKEERYFVVCLEDGVPVVDVLSNDTDARNALGADERPIWSDNPVAYPNCQVADFGWLSTGADRGARLARLPINPWPPVCTVAMMAIATAIVVANDHMAARKKDRMEAERARAADPAPKYLAALKAEGERMWVDRDALVAAASSMFDFPLLVPGWALGSAECGAIRQTCTRRWIRKGGTFDDLKRAVPEDDIEIILPGGSGTPMLDVAVTSHHVRLPRSVSTKGHRPLTTIQAELADAGSQLQVWRTANIALELKAPVLWPRVPDVPQSFRHRAALLSGAADLLGVPGPFILEALQSAPDFISWESVRLDVSPGSGDVREGLKFSATGVFYASAQ
jgi:hypothetical protein